MPALVKVQTNHGVVLFEGDFSEGALEEIALHDRIGDVIKATDTKVADLAATVRNCAEGLLDGIEVLAARTADRASLSGAVIEFGVKVTGEGNAIVAKGSVEANIKVTLSWDIA